jgi:hypothetical protein
VFTIVTHIIIALNQRFHMIREPHQSQEDNKINMIGCLGAVEEEKETG